MKIISNNKINILRFKTVKNNNNQLPIPYDSVSFSAKNKEIKGKEVSIINVKKKMLIGSKNTEAILTSRVLNETQGYKDRKIIEYRVYSKNKKLLGHMRLLDSKINQYDIDRKKEKDYIHITYLETAGNKKYKGIGQKLVQAAIERSLKNGHNGRVVLTAEHLGNSELRELPIQYGCPTGFYYEKCHFKAKKFQTITNEKIENELDRVKKEGKQPSEAKLDIVKMYLPRKELNGFWLPKIKEQPLVLSNNELDKF